MKEILERHDVPLRLGPASIGEARAEYATIAAIVSPLAPDADGVIRIGGTRVTLDTVVAAFQEGATAEEIVYRYPSLELADVYAVLATYLQHRSQVETYLRKRKDQRDEVRSENEARFDPRGIRDRLMSRRAESKAADSAAIGPLTRISTTTSSEACCAGSPISISSACRTPTCLARMTRRCLNGRLRRGVHC